MGDFIIFSVVSLFLAVVWTLFMILIGFRLGRMTAGKPMEAIVTPKSAGKAGIEEDVYYEPMHGRPQNVSTVEDK